jgi:PKHD-type hydroxylase
LVNIFYQLNEVKDFQPVLSVENIFTLQELDALNEDLLNVNTEAGITGASYSKISSEEEYLEKINDSHSMRKSNVYWCTDSKFLWIYDKLSTAINHVNKTNYNKVLYGLEPLQYAEYDSEYSGFFGVHSDSFDEQYPLIRSLSFSVQLSRETEYTGGDLVIYYGDKVIKANKQYGAITFFDSKTPHEVTPVVSGFRKSLVGWVIGPRV